MDIFASSCLRANVVAWLPIKKNDRVCYIGKDTDVIAGKLREMSDRVSCTGKDDAVEKEAYDYVISLSGATREELRAYYECLTDTGILILAAPNAYGLKYLAGAKEPGSMEYFGSVEAAQNSFGVTKDELSEDVAAAGFAWQKFYYPFPDHYFAMNIYSDDYLPKKGELIDQIGNFDADRLVLFDEAKAADVLIDRGKFKDFANAYLVAAGKTATRHLENDDKESIVYVKFSNDRGKRHNIRTYITKSGDGRLHLQKMADGKEAQPQIERIKQAYQALTDLYADTKFKINKYKDRKGGVELEYLSGHTLEEELDALLFRAEYEKASDKMSELFREICSCKNTKEFRMTEEFAEVFEVRELPAGLLAAPFCDIDMIMPNILVGEDGKWTVIDYEWSFAFPIPQNFILYRNIRYYADTTAARRKADSVELYKKAGITEEELSLYARMEESFQNYVLDGHVPMRRLYKEAGKPAYHITSLLHVADELERRRALQVYFDKGAGFSEDCVTTYRSKALDGTYRLEIPVKGDVERLRIDPGSQACTVEIKRLSFQDISCGGKKKMILDFVSNGHKMDENRYLFDTDDPNILLEQLPAGDKTLFLDMRVDSMSLAAAEWIAPKIDAKYRLKKILKK